MGQKNGEYVEPVGPRMAADIVEHRRLFGKKYRQLAREFNVSVATVCRIVKGTDRFRRVDVDLKVPSGEKY